MASRGKEDEGSRMKSSGCSQKSITGDVPGPHIPVKSLGLPCSVLSCISNGSALPASAVPNKFTVTGAVRAAGMLNGELYKLSSAGWKRLRLLCLFGDPIFAFHAPFAHGISVLVSGVAQVQFPVPGVPTCETPAQELLNSPFSITVLQFSHHLSTCSAP